MRIQFKLNTALLSYCPCVRVFVCHRRDISHFSHIQRHKCHVNHQGTHQTLYILNQNHPGYLSSKDQTRQDHLFSALTNLTIDFDFELQKIKMLNPQCLLCLVYSRISIGFMGPHPLSSIILPLWVFQSLLPGLTCITPCSILDH